MHERHAYVTVNTKVQDSLLLLQACPVMAFVKYVFVFTVKLIIFWNKDLIFLVV